ncbi:phosphate-starvation-inducible PsiE family protein [Halosimplex amylolyticum]|uniref:phosphate-starvation-inducible PsiE family protein n=1 Tax=Halosimplex amylolyticum TaxID=3396616 RepID=UPI003F54FD79
MDDSGKPPDGPKGTDDATEGSPSVSDRRVTRFTESLSETVVAIQAVIALVLVVVLVVGVINLLATLVRAAQAFEILGYKNAVGLINTTIDIVLYLFIVIELFRTIVAYVEAKNVVKAVIHAGLIAVVRQIIIFKPSDVESSEDAIMLAGVYLLLLVGLFLGFFLVHRMERD